MTRRCAGSTFVGVTMPAREVRVPCVLPEGHEEACLGWAPTVGGAERLTRWSAPARRGDALVAQPDTVRPPVPGMQAMGRRVDELALRLQTVEGRLVVLEGGRAAGARCLRLEVLTGDDVAARARRCVLPPAHGGPCMFTVAS